MRNPRRQHPHSSANASHGGDALEQSHQQQQHPDHTHSHTHTGLTIVIKLGSTSIVSEKDLQPQLALLSAITETVCALRKLGHRVVLVSSGAQAMGLKRMELKKKSKVLAERQALAAIGQGRLIALWDNLFSLLGQPIAQVLLTRSDVMDRSRYLNSTRALSALLNYGVVPIVNENDTISVSEIKFGDNDTLSAITASMVQADYLFLLTDVDCLYTENPRRFPDTAKPVRIVRDIETLRELVSTATLGSSLGTGGMETKLIAAELATAAGVATVITHGRRPSSILEIVSKDALLDLPEVDEAAEPALMTSRTEAEGQGSATDAGPTTAAAAAAANRAPEPQSQQAARDEAYMHETPLHTIFVPKETPLSDRRWWVLHGLKPRGRIIIDEGAYRAIARSSTHASAGSRYPAASQPSPIVPLLVQATAAIASAAAAGPATSASAVAETSKDRSPSHSSGSTGNGGRLLPAGVIAVEGTFAAGQAVTVVVQKKRRGGRNAAERPPRQDRRERKDSATAGTRSDAAAALPPSMSSSIISETGHSLDTPEQSRPPSPIAQRSRTQRQRGDYHSTTEDQDDDDEAEGEAEEQIEFGRGLANYNSQEIDKIKGHKSSEIEKILGYIEAEHCVESITSLKRLVL